ncbi:MAG TPA: tetratricopeptide repeat protein [Candidatus Methylomirabilis sp.]|nr:tetratricopeptide repeat protein [Candidatus Methylomirabilis sp.]
MSSAQLIAIVAIALPALGFALWPLWRARGEHAPAPGIAPSDRRLELLEEKASAYRALKELTFDYEAGHLSEDDYRGLRERYESRAAEVLEALDAISPPPPAREQAEPTAMPTPRRGWARHPAVLVGGTIVILAFGIIIGLNAGRFAQPEPPMAASASMPPGSGAGAPMAPGAPGRPIPPGVLAGMLNAARQSLMAGRYAEAIAAYQAVLKRDPRNVDAMTHLGLIVAIGGHADAAIEAFDKAATIDPDYAPIYLYRGQVLYEVKQDYKGAIKAWERYVALVPQGENHDHAVELIKDAQNKQRGQR